MYEWREWRARSGLTQASLAAAIGVSRPAISRLEHGLQGLAACRLGRLVDALGLSDGERAHALVLLQRQGHRGSSSSLTDGTGHPSPGRRDAALSLS